MLRRLDRESRQAAPGRFLDLPDGMVHYRVSGDAQGPVVVLVHGFAAPSFSWKYTTEDLVNAGYRVICFDLYGRGWSDRPQLTYDLELFDRQLGGVLDGLKIHAPVGLIGWSMGGLICSVFAARHPSRVRSLSVIGPAGLPVSVSLAPVVKMPLIGELFMASVGIGALRSGLQRIFHDPTHLPWFRENFNVQTRFEGYAEALLSTLRNMPLDDIEAVYAHLGRSGLPVQVIWGRHDRVCPHDNHHRLRELIPLAVVRSVDDAGHAPHIEQRALVSPWFIQFHQP